jgi:hypothetical protein
MFAVLDSLVAWVAARQRLLGHPALVTALLVAGAVAIACPDYRHFGPFQDKAWAAAALQWKIDHPFSIIPVDRFSADAPPGSSGTIEHLRKRTYRITVPLAAHVLHLGLRGAALVAQIAAVLFLWVVYRLFQRGLKDPVAALFASVAVAASFIGQWGLYDFTYFDGVAYCLVALSLWTRRVWLLPVLLVLAGFSDERAILTVPLVYVFHSQDGVSLTASLARTTPLQRAVVVGTVTFVVLRVAFGWSLGTMADASSSIRLALTYNVLVFPLAILLVLKGASVLVGAGLLQLGRLRAAAGLILAALPTVVASAMVYDLSRSLAYGFPAVFICAAALQRTEALPSVRRLTCLAAGVSVVMPSYYILLGLVPMLPILRLL